MNDETATFLRQVQRVQKDLDETHRLRRVDSHRLPTPQREGLDTSLLDVEDALRGVATLIENSRLDAQKGKSVTETQVHLDLE